MGSGAEECVCVCVYVCKWGASGVQVGEGGSFRMLKAFVENMCTVAFSSRRGELRMAERNRTLDRTACSA